MDQFFIRNSRIKSNVFLGEEFFDYNNDLKFNDGEPYTDSNGNCIRDPKEEIIGDNGNGIWDVGEFFYDCGVVANTRLCVDCSSEVSGGDHCEDPNLYHPYGLNQIPEDINDPDYDDCPCNSVGVCVLNTNIYNEADILKKLATGEDTSSFFPKPELEFMN